MKHFKVGFTGTRNGMTIIQSDTFASLIAKHAVSARDVGEQCEFHHGDCVGADAEAHVMAQREYGQRLVLAMIIHPPIDERFRARMGTNETNVKILEPKEYLDRNRDIVDCTDFLIATPSDSIKQARSGTWMTIRYALKQKKKVVIVFSDGKIKVELG